MSFFQFTLQLGNITATFNTVDLAGFGVVLVAILFILIAGSVFLKRFFYDIGQKIYGLEKVVLLVRVPKNMPEQEGGAQKLQEAIAGAEAFFSSVGGLKAERGWGARFFGRRDQVSFEMVYHEGLIRFYVAMPKHLKNYVEEQLHAQYAGATIEEVEDYNIFPPRGFVEAAYLTLKRSNVFPLKTYRDLETDPLNPIANALAKLGPADGAAVQVLARSARAEWRSEGIRLASSMQQGKSLKQASDKGALSGFGTALKETVRSKPKLEGGQAEKELYRLSPLEEEMVKGLEEKASKAGLDANIRVVVSGRTREEAKAHLENIVNAFSQFNIYQYGNSFKTEVMSSPRKLKRMISAFVYRAFSEKMKIVLNTEEMASVFHFPLWSTETPKIDWLASTKAQPPANMPAEGLLLGVSEFRGEEISVRIKPEDRRRHLYVIGMTGTGKSNFMEGLAIEDIKNGAGVAFIDPHGDAISHILERIPKERADDVILFDPSDYERPLAMNILEFDTQEQKIFVINELLAIFDKLYDLRATGGPMFEQYMRNALMLIMDDPESGSTMLEVPKVLSDEAFRKFKLSKSKTPVVKDFWEKEAQKAGGEAALANMVPYITSKLTPFIANDLVRPIISQQHSSFNFREAMDSRKIVLVNLAKGKIGDLNANLLGMIIIGKILMAALGRADLPETERKDFYLYIDEFQNFLTESINVILSEARKYRLNLTIGHQYIGQLVKGGDTKFRDAIFGNVGTKVCFRIGVEDAEIMAKEYEPVFGANDLINIPRFNAYVKLLIDNANPPPFNMRTAPLPEGNPALAAQVRELSRLKYGKHRSIVEAEVLERTKV